MQQIKTFFYVLVKSISDPRYYSDIVKTKAWFSWKYFLVLNALLSLVVLRAAVPAMLDFNPQQTADQVVALFPEELEVTFNQEGVEINQERPYSIMMPDAFFEAENADSTYEDVALVTFVSDDQLSGVQDFYDLRSLIVFSDSSIYTLEDLETGEVKIYAMPEFEEQLTVGYADVKKVADTAISIPFISQKLYVPTLSVLLVIASFVLSTWWRIVALLVMSLLILVLAKLFLKSQALSFGKTFQLAMHALTLPLLVKIVLDQLSIFYFGGLVFVVVFIGWMLFLLSQVENKPSKQSTVAKKKTTKRAAKK